MEWELNPNSVMLYALSVFVVDYSGNTYHAVGDTRANSIEEAEGQCMRVARESYPPLGGWHSHHCVAKQIDFGMKVELQLGAAYEYANETLRNVTQIHYNYQRNVMERSCRVALESNIHRTGVTYDIADIVEFEVTPETEIHGSF